MLLPTGTLTSNLLIAEPNQFIFDTKVWRKSTSAWCGYQKTCCKNCCWNIWGGAVWWSGGYAPREFFKINAEIAYFHAFLHSGGASAVKEPGHFKVRKIIKQVKSPGVPDAAKGSPDLYDLTDSHCAWWEDDLSYFSLPSLLFPSFPSFPFLPVSLFSSLPLPSLFQSSLYPFPLSLPWIQPESLGNATSSRSEVWGEAPAANDFWTFWA